MARLSENAINKREEIKEKFIFLTTEEGYSYMRAYRTCGKEFGKSVRQIRRIVKKCGHHVQ